MSAEDAPLFSKPSLQFPAVFGHLYCLVDAIKDGPAVRVDRARRTG